MSDVAVGVAGAVREAQAHIDAGDLPAALLALRPALAMVTLNVDSPDPDVADAARLYAGVLTSLGESYSALPYSTYAHRAAQALDDPTASHSLQADLIHAFVLRATAQMSDAVALYRDVAHRLATRFGPAGRPAIAGRADLAVALHAAGGCEEARKMLHATCLAHREAFGSADPQGIRMLSRLGVITRDCGGFEQAHQYFDAAKALCAEHLPAADPLVRRVTAAARASSDPGHMCGEPATSQHGLDVRDLFVSALDLDVRDLVVRALDLDVCDPFVSAFEMLTSGATVSITSDLAREANVWVSGVIGRIAGHFTIDGGGSYPFTIDAPEGPRNGLPDHVQIRIFAPGADPNKSSA
jgi:hypothetical protein